MLSHPRSTARLESAIILLILAMIPQVVKGTPGDDSTFSLGLANAESPGSGFGLDLASLPVFDPSVEWDPDSQGPPLVLEYSIASPHFDSATLLDFQDELAEQRWSNGKGRLEAHLRADMLDQMSGGAVGYFQDGSGLDVMAVIRVFKAIHKSIKRRRLPLGGRLPRDQNMIVHVREDDGSIPESISVLPMTLGWVGDVLVAGCDATGACLIEGLPKEVSILLIRGEGSAPTMFRAGNGPHHLILKENGILKLRPPAVSTVPYRVRVTHIPTGLTVPVIRWLNPKREEWTRIPAGGIPLLLPEASYEVEWMDGSHSIRSTAIDVDAGASVEFDLEP